MKNHIVIALLLLSSCKKNTSIDDFQKSDLKSDQASILKSTIKSKGIKNLQELKTRKDSLLSYSQVKASILELKKEWGHLDNIKDTLSYVFKEQLLNRIIPYWEGTTWSFEGHSAIPQKGEIACGYFVSTTLKDVGLNINKYRLAQQNPFLEAKSLALTSEVIHISNSSINKNINEINDLVPEGIHFIGFNQSHVGFILKEGNQLYLIHSNYVNSEGVLIEKIESSEVFKFYSQFYIVELSTNKKLLDYWLSDKEVKVFTNNNNEL